MEVILKFAKFIVGLILVFSFAFQYPPGLISRPPAVLAASYNPSTENLINGTVGVSGTVSNLSSNDSVYRQIRAYSSAFASDYQSAISEAVSTYSTNTTYQTKTTLTWTPPAQDNYFIYATAEIQRTSTTTSRTTSAQMTIDGTTYGEDFVADSTSINSYRTFVAAKIINLTAASHTVLIQYATTNTANTATIKNARIVAFRIGSNYQSAEPANSTLTAATYTDIATLTFTPDVTISWLIIAQSESVNSATTNSNYSNLLIDGTQYAEHLQQVSSTAHYLPAAAHKVSSLSAGSSHTVKIQMKTSSGTMTYRNVRLYAIPLSLFADVQPAISETESTCSTCTSASPTDKTTLTFTPSAASDYVIMANGEINTSSTSVYVAARLNIDGTVYGTSIIQTAATTQYPSFAIHKLINLTAASHTIKIQFYTQTSGTTVKIKDARIVAIRMGPASQQKVEAEYSGASNTLTWASLIWSVDSAWTMASVSVTLQLYNYNTLSYPVSGDGYLAYASSSTANTNETKTQTITTNPANFRDASGNWKIKITGTLSSINWLDFEGDWIEFRSQTPPNAPTQDSPANSATGVSVTPTFLMTATDPDSDNLGYKVTIYSNSACTTIVQTNDQATSSAGWTGTNATCTNNPTNCYTSGTQASFVVQTALSPTTQYWWKASAKDPDGSATFTDSSACNTFTTGAAQSLTFSVSVSSAGFGTLSTSASTYANATGTGSATEVEAHTLTASANASGGYKITVQGATLSSGVNTIAAIGGTSAAPSPGTPQFGLRINITSGTGTVTSPYGTAGQFAYAANASTASQVASGTGDGSSTIFSVRYLANISPVTPAGAYSTTLTYVATGTF